MAQKKDKWIDIAPGIRVCYRNGAVEIQCFGVKDGIKVVAPDGVNMSKEYLPEGETQVDQTMRHTFFENNRGVLVNIQYYAERSPEQVEASKKNAITEDDMKFMFEEFDFDTASEEEIKRAKSIQERIDAQQKQLRTPVTSPNLDINMFTHDWDSEVVLAMWRGEKGPRSPAEMAEILSKLMSGELSMDDLDEGDEDDDADDAADSGGPVLH